MIDRRRVISGLALSGLGAGAALGAPTATSDMGARIDALVGDMARTEHVPGASFVAVRDGEVVHAATFGLRDRERGLPARLDTLFPIGSATKSFTAMAAGVLQDRGLLSLDDHPRKHLPWLRLRDPEADARVTIRDLLSHVTGLRAYADLAAEPGVLTREEYVRAAVSARPEYPFRTRFQYSNAAITAAGVLVGQVGGGTWEEVVTREVLRPLGMRTALASLDVLPSLPDHATGYIYAAAAQDWRPVPPPKSLTVMGPAGAIAASANELALWLKALTRGGAPLVRPRTFAQIVDPQVAISADLAYALGWAAYGWNGMTVIEHNGGSQGICALVSFISQARTGFAFLGNTSPNALTRIASLGPLIYPLLLGAEAGRPGAASPVRPRIGPPSAAPARERSPPAAPDLALGQVLERIAEASGQAEARMRRRTLVARGEKRYENQGVTAALTLRAAEPASHEEVEVWRAAGRGIGRVRGYFDGETGGQETTFGQDGLNDTATNAAMRRAYDFRALANLAALYPNLALAGAGWVGDRPVLRLALQGPGRAGEQLSVDLETWRAVELVSGGVRTVYGDYRPVDGVQLAHRWEIHDPLGLTEIAWNELAFDAALPPGSFKAKR